MLWAGECPSLLSFPSSAMSLWRWQRQRSPSAICVTFVVQWLSRVQLFVTPWTAAHQASLPSLCPRACSNWYPLGQWHHPTISFTVSLFSCCLRSFPASGSFQMSQLFTSWPISASVLPMNIHGWFPLRLAGLISLQSKGCSRVFSSTTVWKHWFFGVQLFLWSNSHIYTWLLEKQ